MKKYNNFLETSLKNLRMSMSEWSLDNFILMTIEALMDVERSEYLVRATGSDKGNGYYSRALRSLSKDCLTVNIPRTRTGDFTPNAIELIKIGQERINELCLTLYRKGVTSRDVSAIVSELFGDSVSATKVTNLAKSFNEFRIAWENSELQRRYLAIFADCIFITVKRGDSYTKEAVYLAYGVREDLHREIVSLSINPTEGAFNWGELLEDLKMRGVQSVDLFIADGLTNLEDEIHRVFPGAQFQKCVVHKMRNILNKTRPRDKTAMAEDLKEMFDNFSESDTVERAMLKVEKFIIKWKKTYSHIANYFKDGNIEYYFTYIKFNTQVRRMIYTTNSIENINRLIRKATKNKLSFESPETLLDYIFMVVKDFEDRNMMKYPVLNYKYFKSLD
jgi:putative transposase